MLLHRCLNQQSSATLPWANLELVITLFTLRYLCSSKSTLIKPLDTNWIKPSFKAVSDGTQILLNKTKDEDQEE